MGVWPVQKGAPIDLGEGAMLSNHNIAARIAIEWPYTVEQVEMVVDAARGSESVTRKALEITKGFSDNHIALACMWARCSGLLGLWVSLTDRYQRLRAKIFIQDDLLDRAQALVTDVTKLKGRSVELRSLTDESENK